jgi:hypothetical protein
MAKAFQFLAIPFLLFSLGFCVSAAEFNCEVIKYISYREIVNGKLITTDSITLQINNRTGEQYADISLPYNKENPISDLSAWIEDKNGQIVRYLKNKETVDVNAISASFYTDDYRKKFTLKHSDYPYRICYTYKSSFRQFMTIASWDPVVGYNVPTRYAKLILKHPEEYEVKIMQNHVDPPSTSLEAGIIVNTWNCTYDGLFKAETYSPEATRFLPFIFIVPVHFIYGVSGNSSSWRSFGEWQATLIQGLDELPESEKQMVYDLIANITDRKEIIKILYHYLQDHTQYVSVQIGLGGMRPYPASYVAQNRYGDCKALTIYMKALLKYAGINSYYTLVHAGFQPEEFLPDLPSAQFNHAILTVPIENDTLWLENTNNCNPFGYIGTFIQNRQALMIDGSSSRLIRIPSLQQYETRKINSLRFRLYEADSVIVSSKSILRGKSFESVNHVISNYSLEDQNIFVHKNLPFPAFELENWALVKRGRDIRNLSIEVTLKLNPIVKPIGNQFYFSYQAVDMPGFEKPQNRKLPVQIPVPLNTVDTLIYQLSAGRTFVTEMPAKILESKYGRYGINYSIEGSQLIILRELLLFSGTIPVNEYPEFYKFISSVKEEEKHKILYQ